MNRETVLLLAGPRALLMQLAHPLVAAGVAAHSDFRREPIARLRRTLDAMLGMIYGTRDEALALADRVNRVHARVAGVLDVDTAAFPKGARYHAFDPALLFWVHATLVDSALAAYECFVSPLTAAEREAFYQESKELARLLRVPEARLPPTHQDFARIVGDEIEGPALEITPDARELADAVLHPPVPLLPWALADAGSILTRGLLPPVLRRRYGLAWERRHELAWRAARGLVVGTLPLLPDFARAMPHERRARRRSQAPPTLPAPGRAAPHGAAPDGAADDRAE